ncbi:MAG: D-TA family PLP-dependent enzyme [Gemmataceae bacterium]
MSHLYTLLDAPAIETPALVFYPDVIRRNVAQVVEMAGGPDRLRPHAKTHKTREITKLQLAAGVTKHKCATIAEAEMLLSCGVPDVILAYPAIGPNAVRLARLAKQYSTAFVSSLIDSEAGASMLSKAAVELGVTLGFLVDLDVGQHRTGIVPDRAAALYCLAAGLPGLKPNGLHAYDGHNRSESRAERDAMAAESLRTVATVRSQIESAGVSVPRIVSGGTPGFPSYAAIRNVPGLECSPGTYVLHDSGYGNSYPDLTGVTPAAVVLTRVISKPTANRVTFDIGTKAVASDPPAGKRLVLLEQPDAVAVGHNEEHYIVEVPNPDRWQIGDFAYAVPIHICPTVALYREALTAEGGRITGQWSIVARDRKLTI